MVSGTLYVFSISPRSIWLPALASYCGHTIKAVQHNEDPNFKTLFPLGKTPAFISDDGEKITEMVAIIEYFVLNAEDETKADFTGKTKTERVEYLRWMSFFNSDVIDALVKIAWSPDEASKKQGHELFAKYATYVENILAEGKTKFLAADRVLAVDIFANAIFSTFAHFGIDFSQYKNISKYLDEVKTHELVK